MKEKKRNIEYPELKPDKDRLWRNIEPYILTDGLYREVNKESLEKGLANLPVMVPRKMIWDKVASEITFVPKRVIKISWKHVAGIAAAILFLFILQTVFFQKSVKVDAEFDNNISSADNEIELFFANLCVKSPQKCKTPDFLELKSEILMLQAEKLEIHDQVFYHVDDQNINNIMDKIDKQIISLKKQIEVYVSL